MEVALPCWLLGLVVEMQTMRSPCSGWAPGACPSARQLQASIPVPAPFWAETRHALSTTWGEKYVPVLRAGSVVGTAVQSTWAAGSKRRPGMCPSAGFAQPHRPISRCRRCWSRASSGLKGTAPAAKPAEDPSCCQGWPMSWAVAMACAGRRGAGRQGCAGTSLGRRMLPFSLAFFFSRNDGRGTWRRGPQGAGGMQVHGRVLSNTGCAAGVWPGGGSSINKGHFRHLLDPQKQS